MQILRSTEIDTNTQVSGDRNKLQQMWEKGHYAKVCRLEYTNNETEKCLTEEETDGRNVTLKD